MARTLIICLSALAVAAHAQVDAEDAAHRADRGQTEQLNRQALQASQPRITYRDRADSDYRSARARYERDLAAWRRQVAACEAGDVSACR